VKNKIKYGTGFAECLSDQEKTMILLAAAFFFFSSSVLAETLPPSVGLSLNQEEQKIQLQTQEFETLYRTDQVPDTCYREETQGSRTECRTENEQQCDTRYEQDCRYRSYPVCQQVIRPVCYPQQVCHTVMDSVCNSRGCQSVPRRVCQTQNQCHNQWDTVCHQDQRYECQNVPRTICQNVPRQVCSQVPNVVRVPYACQRAVQVPIGQKLKLDTIARVQIRIANLRDLEPGAETLTATLVSGRVILSSKSTNTLIRIVEENQESRRIGETQAEVDARFLLELVPVQSLNSLSGLGLEQGRLEGNRIEFQLKKIPSFPLKGNLVLIRKRWLGGKKTLVSTDFDARAIVIQGTTAQLMLAPFGVEHLRNRRHEIILTLSPDLVALKKGLINPEVLTQIQPGGTELRFIDKP
jgi:hypothetical protein